MLENTIKDALQSHAAWKASEDCLDVKPFKGDYQGQSARHLYKTHFTLQYERYERAMNEAFYTAVMYGQEIPLLNCYKDDDKMFLSLLNYRSTEQDGILNQVLKRGMHSLWGKIFERTRTNKQKEAFLNCLKVSDQSSIELVASDTYEHMRVPVETHVFDFDGVCHTYMQPLTAEQLESRHPVSFDITDETYRKVNRVVIEKMKAIKAAGKRVVILTANNVAEPKIKDYLGHFGVAVDEVYLYMGNKGLWLETNKENINIVSFTDDSMAHVRVAPDDIKVFWSLPELQILVEWRQPPCYSSCESCECIGQF